MYNKKNNTGAVKTGDAEIYFASENILDPNYYTHITILNIISSLREGNYNAFFLNVNLLENILIAKGDLTENDLKQIEENLKKKIQNQEYDEQTKLFMLYSEKFKYLLRIALEPSTLEEVLQV